MEGQIWKFISHVTFKITTVFSSTNKIQNACIYRNHSYTHCSTSSIDCLLPTQLYHVKLRWGKTNSLARTFCQRISAVYNWSKKTSSNIILSHVYTHSLSYEMEPINILRSRGISESERVSRVAPLQMNALWRNKKNEVALAILVLKKIWQGTLMLTLFSVLSFILSHSIVINV